MEASKRARAKERRSENAKERKSEEGEIEGVSKKTHHTLHAQPRVYYQFQACCKAQHA